MMEITINPGAKIINVSSGSLLLDVLKQANISIITPCGGKGNCGKCKVKVSSAAIKGNLLNIIEKKWLSEEEIKEGFRLACQCHLYHNSTITIPSSALMRNNNSKIEEKAISHLSHYEFKPVIPIKKYFLKPNSPDLENQSSDWTRIKDELNRVAKIKKERWFIAPDILSNVPQLLRDNNYGMTTVLYKNEVISVEPGDTSKEMYGVAFDIGTTTIAGYLIDFNTGKQIVAEAGSNPQYIYGDDVVSRIDFARKNAINRNIIQQELISFLNKIIASLTQKAGIKLSRIYFAVLAGNTAMHHFLWSLPTENLVSSPYIPVLTEGFFKEARDLPDLCLIPHAKVYSTPNVSAYIGGDIIADLIDIQIWERNNNTLIVDLGTNGEIVLKSDDKIWACSSAAGPALEGARISSGMRAIRGAIDRIIITEHKIRYQVIEQTLAAGLCGSGIIDLIASLLKLQLIKPDGRLVNQEECPNGISEQIKERIVKERKGNKFLIVPKEQSAGDKPIFLTQRDIREVQLAKGAVRAGISILLEYARLKKDDIDEVLLAGSFGSLMDTDNALAIGLIPYISSGKIFSIGNAAGRGAIKLLLSEDMRNIAESLSQKVHYVELSAQHSFSEAFTKSMIFNLER